jgi:UDP-2,4-diacetamido-2,4,6-trideoxy-beta-L-altropyranose hydrolase
MIPDDACVVLRYDADNTIGYGHLSRCRSLGYYLKKRGRRVVHVLRHADQAALDVLSDAGEQCVHVPDDVPLADEAAYLIEVEGSLRIEAVVLDVSTSYNLDDVDSVSDCVASLGRFCKVCLIDSVRDQALAPYLKSRCDIVVVPYLGFEDPKPMSHVGTYLVGPSYFIFGPEYAGAGALRRDHPTLANRILLTFGGSDPTATTLLVLEALGFIRDEAFCVRVVIGPGFTREVRERAAAVCDGLGHEVCFIKAPDSLLEHMRWCDLAITSTGLTKYELAFTGTPSLQISIDALHAEIHTAFSTLGTARHLGVHSDVRAETVAREVKRLVSDVVERRRMSETGREVVDGRGGERIVTALLDSCAVNAREVV